MNKLEEFVKTYNEYSYPLHYPFWISCREMNWDGIFECNIFVHKHDTETNTDKFLLKIKNTVSSTVSNFTEICRNDVIRGFNNIGFEEYLK